MARERSAIDAWRQLVAAAGNVYTDNLALGVCVADLCGHWKDELAALEKGLASLEQKRVTLQAGASSGKMAVPYKDGDRSQFRISHQPVDSAPAGKPIAISVQVSAPAGIKWVRLRYRNVNQELDYQTLPMQSSGEKGAYSALVPAEQINPKWDFMYFIEIMDNNGVGTIYPDLTTETPYRIVKLIR